MGERKLTRVDVKTVFMRGKSEIPLSRMEIEESRREREERRDITEAAREAFVLECAILGIWEVSCFHQGGIVAESKYRLKVHNVGRAACARAILRPALIASKALVRFSVIRCSYNRIHSFKGSHWVSK